MSTKAARRVHYSGRVQGVGFRATAAQIARRWPVTGWVRNLPDGRVELLAEGDTDAVENYLAAMRKYWGEYIENEEIEEQAYSGEATGFRIVH
jgi:acylphosphatase